MLILQVGIDVWFGYVGQPDRIGLVRNGLRVTQLRKAYLFVRPMEAECIIICRCVVVDVLLQPPAHALILAACLVIWRRNVLIKGRHIVEVLHLVGR